MIRELTRECVHCGFCLPTCPTYVLWSEEMDSPRGRIQLMEARLDGTIALNRTVVEHFDRCLGCMACVSSCPSGVKYDRLIEATRDTVEREFRRTPTERLVRSLLFQLLPYPRRMGAALRLAAPARRVPLPARTAAAGRDRAAVAVDRAAPGADPRERRGDRPRRHPHRLRPVRRLRRRQRRHRPRARRRRLRGRRAAAGLLRRALRPRRPSRGRQEPSRAG